MREVVLYKTSSKEPRPSTSGSSARALPPPPSSDSDSTGPGLPEGDALRRCANCRKAETADLKLKRCGSCRNILYCSGKCQKENWSRHKGSCRAGLPAQEDQLAQYGYTSAAAFSRDIRDYVDAHSWAIQNLVMITRQIWRDTHPHTPITQQPRLIRFTLRCQTTPDSHKNRNPATRFAIVGEPHLGDMAQWIRDCPHWWDQSAEFRAELERKYTRELPGDFMGLFAIEYYVPETNSCTMDFIPIQYPTVTDPDPHMRQPLFNDMAQFSLKSMNGGFPLRMSDEASDGQVAIPGRFVRAGKSWQWKPLFNSWNEYTPGQGSDDVFRKLDAAISSRTFFHGPMNKLMKAQAWYCTI